MTRKIHYSLCHWVDGVAVEPQEKRLLCVNAILNNVGQFPIGLVMAYTGHLIFNRSSIGVEVVAGVVDAELYDRSNIILLYHIRAPIP